MSQQYSVNETDLSNRQLFGLSVDRWAKTQPSKIPQSRLGGYKLSGQIQFNRFQKRNSRSERLNKSRLDVGVTQKFVVDQTFIIRVFKLILPVYTRERGLEIRNKARN